MIDQEAKRLLKDMIDRGLCVGDMQHSNDGEFAEEIKKFLREVE